MGSDISGVIRLQGWVIATVTLFITPRLLGFMGCTVDDTTLRTRNYNAAFISSTVRVCGSLALQSLGSRAMV